MKNSLLLSFAALGTLASSAFATDLPTKKGPPPAPTIVMAPYSWAGFYVGVNGGYADPTAKLSVAPGGGWVGDVDWNANANGPGITGVGTHDIGLHGFVGGVTAGYNYQFSNFVVGVEADADYMHLRGSYATSSNYGLDSGYYWANGSAGVDSLFTIRGRAGVAFDRLLVFVTGGVAFADEKFSQSIGFYNPGEKPPALPITPPGGAYGYNAGSASSMVVTGVVGAGLEYAFDSRWSLKGEYLYVPLKSQSFSSSYTDSTDTVYTVRHHESLSALNVFRVGLNYRLP
jgi:outer membrane immunogenic protein